MFRSVAFETDGLRDVLQCLLEKSIRLLADPGELNTDAGGDNYLSVDVNVRLNTRVEFFSLLLGTVQLVLEYSQSLLLIVKLVTGYFKNFRP